MKKNGSTKANASVAKNTAMKIFSMPFCAYCVQISTTFLLSATDALSEPSSLIFALMNSTANIKLEGSEKASVADSKKVVEICTQYAQRGMWNIFLTVFFITLAFACLESYFFIGYLISIAIFGLYQAIFMADAGGAWDNAKKVV